MEVQDLRNDSQDGHLGETSPVVHQKDERDGKQHQAWLYGPKKEERDRKLDRMCIVCRLSEKDTRSVRTAMRSSRDRPD